MLQDLNDVVSIQLEVSDDQENFKMYREIMHEDVSSLVYMDSALEMIRCLLNEGRKICSIGLYKSFRLRISTDKENYFLFDASLRPVNQVEPASVFVPEKERQKYNLLTQKEKEILCFTFRGYPLEEIAEIFETKVNTIKRHQLNIYNKTGFRSFRQLSDWCEKYLNEVLDLEPDAELSG
jgi:DNA-binding CsgD family transcriptional regulator